jgi:hypothetical protein
VCDRARLHRRAGLEDRDLISAAGIRRPSGSVQYESFGAEVHEILFRAFSISGFPRSSQGAQILQAVNNFRPDGVREHSSICGCCTFSSSADSPPTGLSKNRFSSGRRVKPQAQGSSSSLRSSGCGSRLKPELFPQARKASVVGASVAEEKNYELDNTHGTDRAHRR